jgi:hypothetical protein
MDEPLPQSLWERTDSQYDPIDSDDINRNRVLKKMTKSLGSAASTGGTIASYAGHTGGIVALATGAAISATGIGLAAGGVALTLGSMVQAGRSWRKTSGHISGLKDIEVHWEQSQYSPAERDAIQRMNSDDAGDLLMDKMKSG